MYKVIAEHARQGQHRRSLEQLLESANGTVRVASAYVTDTKLLLAAKGRRPQLLTSVSAVDIVSGATSLDSLRSLIEAGIECRYLSGNPRLHAKVYIFGDEFAVVTSANLTPSALDRNIEVGVELTGQAVNELVAWFNAHWERAMPLDEAQVSLWRGQFARARIEFRALRERIEAEPISRLGGQQGLRDLLDETMLGPRSGKPRLFFHCNTDRAHGTHREEKMHARGYAVAWEVFSYPEHMTRAEDEHVILMYANGLGVVGIGEATGACETLEPGDSRRILSDGDGDENAREWRIPVRWLFWDAGNPCPWSPPPNQTFVDVSGETWRGRRDGVRRHLGALQ